MRIVRFVSATTTTPSYGLVEGDQVRTAEGSPFDGELQPTGTLTPLSQVTLLAPCEPTKIVAGGISYRSHANEMKLQIPDEPVFFLKPATCMTGHNAEIDYPRQSERLEYEAELAVIIRKKTYKASPEEAKANILGYACANDVTARDIQARGGNMVQLCHSKAFDTFCPVGPWIETELDANNVDVSLTVNGETRQQGNTSDMIFTIEEMVSFFSHIMTLLPGDVVLTGTPYGVGEIKSGDVVNVTVQGIGTLSNRVGFKS
ncbi:fumarylacetoacetate hydrolase family protein [Tianweitania sediminis]|jgi:2-keto-4-pentenoate hydratase/2-oxohepta-3-ene-1,7-dioic acid hydratase in catechol pathway|uniref:Fumarylacetoacetate hydrolase family protein n=1 Tax=Tianweitania sediminis TaxID=1502156 RepID=A0A8J7UL58_9HYPH|nr:fumarylacetoacetate hydrolase family protein [Tianweitania sediminis]MBP0440384.1 fumarylacetoacetate hydrolase family protein [Tianweitania sediminis]